MNPDSKFRLHENRQTHDRMKRWERSRQRMQWGKFRGIENSGTLPALFRSADQLSVRPASLWEQYREGWSLISYVGDAEGQNDFVLVQGGILWHQWIPSLLQAYLWGRPVPKPFRPTRRISPEIWARAESLSVENTNQLLIKLRDEGFLPTLPELEPKTLSAYFPWTDKTARSFVFTSEDRKKGAENYPE